MNPTPIHGFKNREDAGRQLAALLWRYSGDANTIILALPRGGVPIAAEIARIIARPFDILTVRKLVVPGHEELAIGAIAGGGIRILNREIIDQLGLGGDDVETVIRRESSELERREILYRSGQPPPTVAGKNVIIVDDGIATGSTMFAAIGLLRKQQAERIVVAVPVAARDSVDRLRGQADEVVVALEPEPFIAVSRWYEDFSQTSDGEVRALLAGEPSVAGADNAAGFISNKNTLQTIRRHAIPLSGGGSDHDGLLNMIGDASLVFLGGSSHGTHEFYRQRAQITKRLILEKGFNAVCLDADWPDACRVNRFVRGDSRDHDSIGALAGFESFPSWMWRNADVLDFVGWLRNHNDNVYSADRQVGFHGLDLYSLHKSMNEVIACLERTDPAEAAKARMLYGCIDRYGRDPQNYGLLAGAGVSDACRAAVIQQLVDLRVKEAGFVSDDARGAADEGFFAKQNARLVRDAGEYYRRMFRSYVSSWNLRAEQMMELLVELIAHLQSSTGTAKVVVWAHNSQLGDARATEISWRGELNLGQLAREAFPEQTRLIGFTTYTGTVTAAAGWHLAADRQQVLPGMEGSYEKLFHQVGLPDFWLDFTKPGPAADVLKKPLLERSIGIIYQPGSERCSHYFEACLAGQFDAVLHYDITRGVEPLERAQPAREDGTGETRAAGC